MAIFDYSHPKINESTFSFPEFLPACKKSVYLSIHLLTQFLSPVTRLATTIFDHVYPTIFFISFPFLRICINTQEISLFQMFILQIQSILEYRDQIGLTYILTNPNKKNFELLVFVNLYQHAKNEVVSSICSGEIVDLKILRFAESILAYISEPFPRYRIYVRTQQIIQISIIEQIQWKLMTNFFFLNLKTLFLAYFHHFGGKSFQILRRCHKRLHKGF